jgi:transposase
MRLGSPPRYGWAPSGEKSFGKAIHGAWKNVTMLGAIGLNGFRGFMNIEAATSGDVFCAFVAQELVPNLRAGDCVVMDNLAAHKNKAALKAIADAGATYMFLPPYSPEYNPIEKLWSKLKDYVRRTTNDLREEFDDAVAKAMSTISTDDIVAWFKHCGYAVNKT